jgi:hypothetical protein
MDRPKHEIITIISGIFTLIAFSILLHKVYVTKQTEHLSYPWIASILIAQIMIVIYELINKKYEMVILTIIIILIILYVLYTKIIYEENIIIEDELLKNGILAYV